MRRVLLVIAVLIVVPGAFTAALGVAPANAGTGGTAGRVEGRIMLDGKPASEALVTLTSRRALEGTDLRTDSNGRFAFESVEPGRYDFGVTLLLLLPEGKRSLKCKYSRGYRKLELPFRTPEELSTSPSSNPFAFVSLNWKKPFRVKAGGLVKRDIEADCQPDAQVVPPISTGGGALRARVERRRLRGSSTFNFAASWSTESRGGSEPL